MDAKTHNPAIVILSPSGETTAQRIRACVGGEIHGLASRIEGVDVPFDKASEHIAGLFLSGRVIVAVMAAGALIRILAPHLQDKTSEPPVLCVSDDGASVVPLLGGHHGANDLARALAQDFGGHAHTTTAGDLNFGIALDEPPAGWTMGGGGNPKDVMANLLAGSTVQIDGEKAHLADWVSGSKLPVSDDGAARLTFTQNAAQPEEGQLVYHPKTLVLGLGCERGERAEDLIALAEAALASKQLSSHSLACVASIDVKADEAAVHAVADHFGVSARFFTAAELEKQTPRLANPSEVVFAEVGCHGVSEGAALAAVGGAGALIVEKQKSKRGTCAVAESDIVLSADDLGRAQGHLSVVGIGPGQEAWRSPEVRRLVAASTDLVGYSLYLDLLENLTKGKTRHDFDLGKEEDRVRHAMELAGQGRNVSLVCSGDAGIYAMATLVYELLANGGLSQEAQRISIQVSPGISALQAAAARAGAPLGHDFCTISLSDLLTPWPSIQMRLKAAAEGDFVIAFYNPVSKRRRTQLAYAKDVLLAHRPQDTPVILATNLGREGELIRVVPLAELKIDDVDMLTVVIVGSSDTRTVATGDGRTWVYTPRGYAAKEGTKIGSNG